MALEATLAQLPINSEGAYYPTYGAPSMEDGFPLF